MRRASTKTKGFTAGARLLTILLGSVSAAALTLGCAEKSGLIATWQEPGASTGPYENVAAIALARNEATRKIAEDEFSRRLSRETRGIASYRVLTKSDEENVERVVAKLRAEGADSAAVMRLVEEKNTVEYEPGSYWRPYQSFNDYYGGVWSTYHDPGYLTTQIAVRVETAFYSLKDEKASLVWTGYSQSLDPKSAEVVIDDVARLVIGDLRRLKIVR